MIVETLRAMSKEKTTAFTRKAVVFVVVENL